MYNNQYQKVFLPMKIGAGEYLGVVTQPDFCSDGHIHLALRKSGTQNYIDPSRYLEGRKIEVPRWEQQCDKYLLVIMVNIRRKYSTIYN